MHPVTYSLLLIQVSLIIIVLCGGSVNIWLLFAPGVVLILRLIIKHSKPNYTQGNEYNEQQHDFFYGGKYLNNRNN